MDPKEKSRLKRKWKKFDKALTAEFNEEFV